MTDFRFGLRALEEKANISVKLKSKFALTPSAKKVAAKTIIQEALKHIYMGTNTVPGKIVKFSIPEFKETSTIISTYNYLDTIVADTKNGHIYAASWTSPPAILKIRSSDFSIADTLILNSVSPIVCGIIDIAAGFAYFASGFDIIKLDLTTFTVSDILTVELNYDVYESFAVIDVDAGYLYFSRYYDYSIIKIRLSDFTHVDTLDWTLSGMNFNPEGGIIDPTSGYAYFGAVESFGEGYIIRIRLSDFSLDGYILLGAGYIYSGAAIDVEGKAGYFGTNVDPGNLIKLNLDTFTIDSILIFEPGERGIDSLIIDIDAGFIYCTTWDSPSSSTQSSIIKIKISDFTRVDTALLSDGNYGIMASVAV